MKAGLLETHLLCLVGDLPGAERAAKEAIATATERPEVDNAKRLLLWLTQACVYGLDRECLDGADAVANAPELPAAFHDLLGGARALSGAGDSDALLRTAEALRQPNAGERHSELRVLAGWFEAEALRRNGEDDAALERGEAALHEADRLGHVWLQLCLLLLLQRVHANPEREGKAAALVQRIADGLPGAQREAFVSLWSSRVPGQ